MVDPVAEACARTRGMIDGNAPLYDILSCLVTAAETVSGDGAVSSLLVLDDQGLLRNGASPSLPDDYLDAIDGLKPDAGVGTCAAAAATGSIVVTPSFLSDEKWAELRHLPLALGFVAAWSMPIKSARDGKVLGTFGTYYRDLRQPTTGEVAAVRALAAAASRALESAGNKL
jgi:GAF domain-containing protein